MLLPEDRLDVLVDRLKMLPSRDRRAILARLTRAERAHLHAALSDVTKAAEAPVSPYSPQLAARIEGLADDARITPAARDALVRATSQHQAERTTPRAAPSSSLMETALATSWRRR